MVKRLKELKTERVKLVANLKDAALAVVRGAIADLNEIGFHYHLAEGPAPNKIAGTRKSPAEAGTCPICRFKTNPPHDGRTHRYQDPKKAFTNAQLAAKGMSKVA